MIFTRVYRDGNNSPLFGLPFERTTAASDDAAVCGQPLNRVFPDREFIFGVLGFRAQRSSFASSLQGTERTAAWDSGRGMTGRGSGITWPIGYGDVDDSSVFDLSSTHTRDTEPGAKLWYSSNRRLAEVEVCTALESGHEPLMADRGVHEEEAQ